MTDPVVQFALAMIGSALVCLAVAAAIKRFKPPQKILLAVVLLSTLAAAGLVTDALATERRPLLSDWWRDHALATGIMTSVLLLGAGALAIDGGIERARLERRLSTIADIAVEVGYTHYTRLLWHLWLLYPPQILPEDWVQALLYRTHATGMGDQATREFRRLAIDLTDLRDSITPHLVSLAPLNDEASIELSSLLTEYQSNLLSALRVHRLASEELKRIGEIQDATFKQFWKAERAKSENRYNKRVSAAQAWIETWVVVLERVEQRIDELGHRLLASEENRAEIALTCAFELSTEKRWKLVQHQVASWTYRRPRRVPIPSDSIPTNTVHATTRASLAGSAEIPGEFNTYDEAFRRPRIPYWTNTTEGEIPNAAEWIEAARSSRRRWASSDPLCD